MNSDTIILSVSNRLVIGQVIKDTDNYIVLNNVLTINDTVRDDKHITFGQLKHSSAPITFKNYDYKSRANLGIQRLYDDYLKEKSYE